MSCAINPPKLEPKCYGRAAVPQNIHTSTNAGAVPNNTLAPIGFTNRKDSTPGQATGSQPQTSGARLRKRTCEIVGVSVLVGIVSVVFMNASSRYLLNHSFSWAEEAVQMAMPWLAMTGVFLSVRRGTVIRIDFFFEKIPARIQGTRFVGQLAF